MNFSPKESIWTTILGFAAGAFTTFAFLPQLIKAWKSKSTKDISLGMFVIICAGVILWMIYGFLTKSQPIIIANIVTLIFCAVILFLKIRYK